MAIPATAFRWHEQGLVEPGRLIYQGDRWFLSVVVMSPSSPTHCTLCLTGTAKGQLRSQGSNGISEAYVLTSEFEWRPFIEGLPGTVPATGHQYSPAALYVGTNGPAFWAVAGSRLVAFDIFGNDVTDAQNQAARHPYFDQWTAELTIAGKPTVPVSKLFEVGP